MKIRIIRKGKSMIKALIFIAVILGVLLLAGCLKKPGISTRPESGGTTDKTDLQAPKEIKSKEITDFYASFYLDNRWASEDQHDFVFKVTKDEKDVLTASESNSGISHPADQELLDALQKVVDEHHLAHNNGVYKVTAGLPPEYQERSVTILYASGEKLNFTVNNDPVAEWAEDFYTVFADWFSANGDNSLRPEIESSQLTDCYFLYKNGKKIYHYSVRDVSEEKAVDGETHLLEKFATETGSLKSAQPVYIPVPEDYFEKITEIIANTDLLRSYEFSRYDPVAHNYGNHDNGYYGMGVRPENEEPDAEDLEFIMVLNYESGNHFHIKTKKPSELEGMQEIIDKLMEYHNSLF